MGCPTTLDTIQHAAPPAIAAAAADERSRLEQRIAALEKGQARGGMTLIVFSAELDKLMAAFTLATSAAAMQVPTVMFFTFWGLSGVKHRSRYAGKRPLDRLMTLMLPSATSVGTSKFNFLGLGSRFLDYLVRRHDGPRLEELVSLARELGVRLVACHASMEMMGIESDELIEGVECAGATSAIDSALDSRITLFI